MLTDEALEFFSKAWNIANNGFAKTYMSQVRFSQGHFLNSSVCVRGR